MSCHPGRGVRSGKRVRSGRYSILARALTHSTSRSRNCTTAVRRSVARRRRPFASGRDANGVAAGDEGAGISTRRGFASWPACRAGPGEPGTSSSAPRGRARLQVASEYDWGIRYELVEPERNGDGGLVPNRGLLALPEPADGDLFFDIEGARYYSEDGREFGLQYLFGVVDTAEVDEAGLPRYTQIWAFDRAGEKRAFEELIDFITECRGRHPRSARLPLQPLRADLGRPSDRTPRHPPGGGGRADGTFRHP